MVNTYGGMVNAIEARMKAGEEVPDCLAKTLIKTRDEEDLDQLDIAILCGVVMIGGIETVRHGTTHRYIIPESHLRVSGE